MVAVPVSVLPLMPWVGVSFLTFMGSRCRLEALQKGKTDDRKPRAARGWLWDTGLEDLRRALVALRRALEA
jgi:hypothetical protein